MLRPDDVWLATLTQFNFYVNGHADEMRSMFVQHDGKAELSIEVSPGLLSETRVTNFVLKMTCLMEEQIVDKEFRDWVMPSFSTTRDEDRGVAGIVMMGSMQKYFDYVMFIACGFPSVALLGEKKDWEDVLKRVGKLSKYGKEAKEWSVLLTPVVKGMIRTFKRPKDEKAKDFWLKAVHQVGAEGSGGDLETISGWITAFCFWNEKGKRIEGLELEGRALKTRLEERKRLVLDGVKFPLISPKGIPVGLVSVPVKVIDFMSGVEKMATMTAGLVGMTATKKKMKDQRGFDTFQPRSGWWMLEESSKPLRKLT